MRFLMCAPDFYGIFYEINPWMRIQQQPDNQRAQQQWQELYTIMRELGADIDVLDPVQGLPDLVFTANAGLFYRNHIVLPHYHYAERRGELVYAMQWFQQHGFMLHNQVDETTPYFEGAGDALSDGEKLFAGYGFRTERRFYTNTPIFSQQPLIWCELQDTYFYHLDTCFCPLNSKLAIWYPPAFTVETQTRMANATQLIAVTREEALRFACNAIVIDHTVIIPAGCPVLTERLQVAGYSVRAVNVDEFIKAGGACKCLSLRIDA